MFIAQNDIHNRHITSNLIKFQGFKLDGVSLLQPQKIARAQHIVITNTW